MTETAPIYHRIQETLRHDIATGRFSEGDKLPSESELARTFSTTRGTVRHALARLEYEGLIQREAGRGTFATPSRVQSRIDTRFYKSFEEQVASQGSKVSLSLLSFEASRAPESIAQALHLLSGTEVYRLRRLRHVDGEVLGYEDRWLLRELARKIKPSALKTESAVSLINSALQAPLGEIEVFVRATTATDEIAKLLQLRKGAAVLVRAHSFYDAGRRPVLTGQALYRGDRYQFAYALYSPAATGRGSGVPGAP